ncbi:MAG: hypothetical protein KTV68_17320 [Acidimicrobiia bacterium]|nr:hypothetical protein [Acidimicrobiia bacterium]
MPEPEVTVAEFYEPVMSHRRPEVQRLVIRLLQEEFKQTRDLEASIITAAALSRSEPLLEEWASDVDGMITGVDDANIREGGTS